MKKDVISLAWLEMRKRHFSVAIQMLERRADIYEDNFEYYLTLGIAYLYADVMGSASSYFQKARNIKLTDTRLLLGQAAILLRRGHSDKALQYYLEVREKDPNNKIAINAIDFLRTHSEYDVICRWVDTGKIEQFYPPLGSNPEKIAKVTVASVILVLTVSLLVVFMPKKNLYKNARGTDISYLALTTSEIDSAKETDLTGQTYQYILSKKEIAKKYNEALQYFQEGRDNASQVAVNIILNSDATLSIKQKSQVLMGYYEVPDFDSIKDVPSFEQVQKNPSIYLDCWVDWGGKISNVVEYPDGSYSCDLIIGDEELKRYEGTVNVKFNAVPNIQGNQFVKILGKISTDGKNVFVEGRSVYQSIFK